MDCVRMRCEMSERYLLIDSRIIATAKNAEIVVRPASKDTANPLFGEEKPWEQRFDNLYPNTLFDRAENLFKCWYSLFTVDAPSKGMPLENRQTEKYSERPRHGRREMGVCYATSKDGISWDKLELGVVEYEGTKKNNLVVRGPHGSGVFEDTHESDPTRRYKMLTSIPDKGMAVSFSSDGIHWSHETICPEINPYKVDGTHYNALWVEELGEYVGFTRLRNEREGGLESSKKLHSAWPLRQVGRTTSPDFVNWSEAAPVFEGESENLQIYSMPIFRHGSLYLGLPVIHNQETDRAWTELAWSPDTIEWHRVCPGSPLIPNGDLVGDYDWGCAYSAAYPILHNDEILFYYGGSNWLHFGWRDAYLCLARLRTDGYASYEQVSPREPGVIATVPMEASGQILRINADVSDIGTATVRLRAESDGSLIAESVPMRERATDAEVQWRDDFTLSSVAGKKVSIEFTINGARLFSFEIE